ncbi:MAG: 50S ribosomal protein L9 [Candidatus Paceibacterota bacterium]|jgi:large subunit ribosomal protein L9|nr:50S ribosomal protein L9 [Candidatus Paceibacterota bacterium]
MKVILLEDIENLGKKYDVKDVADGFARNSLLPKKLVKIADESSLKWLESQKENMEKEAEEQLKQVQETASKLDGYEVVIEVPVGEEGQLFSSISAQKIADKVGEMGLKIKKSQIELAEPIKEQGEYPLKIKLDHNLEAEIKVIVAAEEK